MRYFLAIFVLCVVTVVGVLGFRGSHSRRTSLYIFPDMEWQLKLRPQYPDGRASRGKLGPRDDLEHSVQFERRGGVDAGDTGVRVRTAAYRHLGRARPVDVVDELPGAAQQAVVLLARHVGAEHGMFHRPRQLADVQVSHRGRSLRGRDGLRRHPR